MNSYEVVQKRGEETLLQSQTLSPIRLGLEFWEGVYLLDWCWLMISYAYLWLLNDFHDQKSCLYALI
jgi:hypothetical protein